MQEVRRLEQEEMSASIPLGLLPPYVSRSQLHIQRVVARIVDKNHAKARQHNSEEDVATSAYGVVRTEGAAE